MALKQEAEQIKKEQFRVVKVEDESAIVLVQGWRKRVYFDADKKAQVAEGQLLEVEYTGDLEDVFTVQFQKLK